MALVGMFITYFNVQDHILQTGKFQSNQNLIMGRKLGVPKLTIDGRGCPCLPSSYALALSSSKLISPVMSQGPLMQNIIQKDEPKCIEGGRGHWLKHDELLIYLLR
jgi:hypothetical protein